jgi:hypothetical protein
MAVHLTLYPGPSDRVVVAGESVSFSIKCCNEGNKPASNVNLTRNAASGNFKGKSLHKVSQLGSKESCDWNLDWVAPKDAAGKDERITFRARGTERKFVRASTEYSASVSVKVTIIEDPIEHLLKPHIPDNEKRGELVRDIKNLNLIVGQLPQNVKDKAVETATHTIEKSPFTKTGLRREIIAGLVVGSLEWIFTKPYFYLYFYGALRSAFHFAPVDQPAERVSEDLVAKPGEHARISSLDELLDVSLNLKITEFDSAFKKMAEEAYDPVRESWAKPWLLEREIINAVFPILVEPFNESVHKLVDEGHNFVIHVWCPEVGKVGEELRSELRVYYAGGLGEKMCNIETTFPENLEFDVGGFEDIMRERGWSEDQIERHRWISPERMKIRCDYEPTRRRLLFDTTWLRPGDMLRLDLPVTGSRVGKFVIGPFKVALQHQPAKQWHSETRSLLLVD